MARQQERVIVLPLGAVDTAGGVVAMRLAHDATLPAGARVAITRVILDVTTKATAACTLDVGIANDGVTSNDTLLDGVDVGTAAGVFDNIENKGTNGKARQTATVGQFVTASKATGAAAGLVGTIAVCYIPLGLYN